MPERDDSLWTIPTLALHIERLITEVERRFEDKIGAQEKAVAIAMNAADRAVTKAEIAAERRFESVNEFRASLNDATRLQIPRLEAEALFKAHSDKNDAAQKALSARVDVLTQSVVALQSRSGGVHAGWGYAVGAVGLISLVVSLIMMLMGRKA